jgi:ribosomal protein S27AE
MPSIACWSCGRRIYATAALEALSPDERRCPRCGALMSAERREIDRRSRIRRENPPADPGPPPESVERRAEERRQGQRRKRS